MKNRSSDGRDHTKIFFILVHNPSWFWLTIKLSTPIDVFHLLKTGEAQDAPDGPVIPEDAIVYCWLTEGVVIVDGSLAFNLTGSSGLIANPLLWFVVGWSRMGKAPRLLGGSLDKDGGDVLTGCNKETTHIKKCYAIGLACKLSCQSAHPVSFSSKTEHEAVAKQLPCRKHVWRNVML